MTNVSFRTLILMLELLAAVIAFQYLTTAKPAQVTVIWLAADSQTASVIQKHVMGPVTAGADLRKP